jgi:CelD/BcsL family acetyltransferase involved in cellulose biosynthesis
MATAFDTSGREPGAHPRNTLEVVPVVEAARVVAEWRGLAGASAESNVFFHPDFALPAIAGLARAVELAVHRSRDGRIAAVAPFTRSRLGRIASAVRLWSHEYGPVGTPLIAEAALEAAVGGLIEGLAPASAGGSLIVPDVPLDGAVASAFRVAAVTRGRPVDVLEAHERAVLSRDAGEARAALVRKRRKQFNRQLRRLGETGDVEFAVARDPATVAAAFEGFLGLEASGWKGRGGSAMAKLPDVATFARRAVAGLAEVGCAQIDTLTLDRAPVAALVSLISGDRAFTWKIAYDETHARYSPGVQIMLHASETLFENPSVQMIDSCATADHPMVNRLWGGRMAFGMLVIGPPGGGILHRLGLAAAAAEVGARAAARKLRD